ncbi:MAG: BlaI/MecI/CopY family transcriptional regulator [Candidatus Bathyarchaeia archaeon]
MPARKMRIEIFDSEGNKYSIAFEGQITREKALRLLDLVELLGGVSSTSTSEVNMSSSGTSKFEKVMSVIHKHFPIAWFTSKEIQAAYEQEFKEPIGLSTVATYLARMANKGLLIKTGTSNRLKYRTSPSPTHIVVKQSAP